MYGLSYVYEYENFEYFEVISKNDQNLFLTKYKKFIDQSKALIEMLRNMLSWKIFELIFRYKKNKKTF
jgi:hypothetical protein